jgi:hypothetical protein
MKAIIYKTDQGNVAVLGLANLADPFTVGVKDVPHGKRFKIVDSSDLPQDVPQEAWEIDDDLLDDGIGGDPTSRKIVIEEETQEEIEDIKEAEEVQDEHN